MNKHGENERMIIIKNNDIIVTLDNLISMLSKWEEAEIKHKGKVGILTKCVEQKIPCK